MHCHKEYLIILAIVSGLILFTTFAVVIWLLVYKRRKRRKKSRKLSNPAELALVPPSWKIFTHEELRPITKNFSKVKEEVDVVLQSIGGEGESERINMKSVLNWVNSLG